MPVGANSLHQLIRHAYRHGLKDVQAEARKETLTDAFRLDIPRPVPFTLANPEKRPLERYQKQPDLL